MRRMNPSRDRGASAIVIVLMMPILLAAGGLVFDGGRGLLARRETQNAADAAAFAKAIDCARNITTTDLTPYATNGTTVGTATCNMTARTATVQMSKVVNIQFTPGASARTVTRSATARWSAPSSARVVPIIVASCEITQSVLDGTADINLYHNDARPAGGCASLSGGFRHIYVDDDDDDDDDEDEGGGGGACSVNVSVGQSVPVSDDDDDLEDLAPCLTPVRDVIVPVYDSSLCRSNSCRRSESLTVVGFAMFRVTGYRLDDRSAGGNCTPGSSRSFSCLRGDFIRWVAPLELGTPSTTTTNFGLVQVLLSS